MWPNVLNDMVCDFVRQWRGSTLNGLEQKRAGFGSPRLSSGQMRSRPQHDKPSRRFLHRGIRNREKICINLLLARMRADQVSKFLRRLPQTVHFTFISLNAG
jgi:hypothetical protein